MALAGGLLPELLGEAEIVFAGVARADDRDAAPVEEALVAAAEEDGRRVRAKPTLQPFRVVRDPSA